VNRRDTQQAKGSGRDVHGQLERVVRFRVPVEVHIVKPTGRAGGVFVPHGESGVPAPPSIDTELEAIGAVR
jgi:hypothetical protein